MMPGVGANRTRPVVWIGVPVLLACGLGCGKTPTVASELSGEETQRRLIGKWQDVSDRSNQVEFFDGGTFLQKFRNVDFRSGLRGKRGPRTKDGPRADNARPKPQLKEITGTYEVRANGAIETLRINSDGETLRGTYRIVKDELQRVKVGTGKQESEPAIITRYRRPEKMKPPPEAGGQ